MEEEYIESLNEYGAIWRVTSFRCELDCDRILIEIFLSRMLFHILNAVKFLAAYIASLQYAYIKIRAHPRLQTP